MTLATPARFIVIDGRELPVRRLNVFDTFTVGRLLARVMSNGGSKLSQDFTQEQVVLVLFGGLEFIEEDVLKLCASLVGMSVDEFGSAPPEALTGIIEALIESEDLAAFLVGCQRVAEKAARAFQK